jgi:hypothetical protein
MLGSVALSIGGRRGRCLECGVNFCLNAARGQGHQPRLGFGGSDAIADLELPSPNTPFGARRDAIFAAFVTENPHSQKRGGLLFTSAINPGIYGIGPIVYLILRGWYDRRARVYSAAQSNASAKSISRKIRGPGETQGGLDAIVPRRSWGFLIGFLRVLLVGFVTADDASCDNADLAVPCHMARDAANDGALDASLRLGGRSTRYGQKADSEDQWFHGGSPKKVAAIIRAAVVGSRNGREWARPADASRMASVAPKVSVLVSAYLARRRATAMPNRNATNRLASGASRVMALMVESGLPGWRDVAMATLNRSTAARRASETSVMVRDTSVAVSMARSAMPGCRVGSVVSMLTMAAFRSL